MSKGPRLLGKRIRFAGQERRWYCGLVDALAIAPVIAIVILAGCQPAADSRQRAENEPSGPDAVALAPEASDTDLVAAELTHTDDLPSRQSDPVTSQPNLKDVEQGPILLHDVTEQTGISFHHTDGSSGRLYIVETVASGLCTFDYDLDGLIDIYFVNGGALPGVEASELPRNRLYRNLGNWQFADVTAAAGVGDTRHGLGATIGDFNNDGYPDVYVSNLGENVLYRNNGDGTFDDISQASGTVVSDDIRVGAGVCFLDREGDGDLDLFVANYMQFSPEQPVSHVWRGQRIYPSPDRFPAYPSVFLSNNGNGTFTDVSQESGIARYPGYGMGIICGDFDHDGATDVFVGNDGGPGNFLFYNDGNGVFEEEGMLSGVAYSGAGLAHGSMGVDSGDFDRDGRLDLFVTSYQRQLATLFRNMGQRGFQDVTQQTGAGLASFNQVTWGCGLVDLDNDSQRDIFYACGHLIDNIDGLDDSTSYLAHPVVMGQSLP